MLTAIEHTGYYEEDGSLLWCQLIKLVKNGKSTSLNPIPIRDIIMNKERERILRGNIAPVNRLFDLGSAEVFQETNPPLDPTECKNLDNRTAKTFLFVFLKTENIGLKSLVCLL